MKIFAWLLMMALTWYLAGLYQISALGLFRRIKRTSRRKYLTVLPEGRGRLFPDPMGTGVTVRYEETPRQQTDLNGTQMDRIDSYRDGDTLKSIHWKLSVRYDELMVKRYQADSGSCAALILRSDFWDKAGMEQINRFLEEEAALIRGLLEDSWQFRLLWKSEEEGRWVSHPMESREDYQGGLEQLMKELASRRKKIERKGQGTEEILRELPLEEGEIPIWLDLEGQLYMDGIPVDFTECWEETE